MQVMESSPVPVWIKASLDDQALQVIRGAWLSSYREKEPQTALVQDQGKMWSPVLHEVDRQDFLRMQNITELHAPWFINNWNIQF